MKNDPNPVAVARWLKRCVRVGECLLWPGEKGDTGHPRARLGGRKVRCHRVVLATKLGRPLEEHERARHTCDNPACMFEGHLIEGSQADNVRDMMARGRHVPGRRKVTAELADYYRQLRGPRRRPRMSVALLADLAGLRKRQMERILSGRAHAQ